MLYRLAAGWTVLGLVAGVFYRELTRARDFTGDSQLSLVHTHVLVLGTVITLMLLVLERVFDLSSRPTFTTGLWVYTVGVGWRVTMLVVNGVRTVYGAERTTLTAWSSGLGHILIAAGLYFLFQALGAATRAAGSTTATAPSSVA